MAERPSRKSIQAYEVSDRVGVYDADMDIMHPLRHKMIEVMLEVLPFEGAESLRVIDLGVGTGVLARRLLERFASARVTAIDGALPMIELAKSRLGTSCDRARFVVADFRALPDDLSDNVDAVLSSYALHHLDETEKAKVVRNVVGLLKPGGWFLNADLCRAMEASIEDRIQQLRVQGVVRRGQGDSRFQDEFSTRAFLNDLEAREGDQPLTLEEDLGILRDCGLAAEVFWKEYREAVIGGPKR